METTCPLCERPRAAGAKRCVCNYTFEFDAPVTSRHARAASSPALPLVLVGVAIIGGIAGFVGLSHLREDSMKPVPDALPVVLVIAGAFSILGGVFGWSWFLANRRARKFVFLFGGTGARGFYALLGGALVGAGISLI